LTPCRTERSAGAACAVGCWQWRYRRHRSRRRSARWVYCAAAANRGGRGSMRVALEQLVRVLEGLIMFDWEEQRDLPGSRAGHAQGFEGLYGMARDRLQCDPLSGHVFLSPMGTQSLKLLFWTGVDYGSAPSAWRRDASAGPRPRRGNKGRAQPRGIGVVAGASICGTSAAMYRATRFSYRDTDIRISLVSYRTSVI